MAISAQDIKELRDRTGAPMMDCKKALDECGADLEAAVEKLRRQGLAKAAKKAGREARDGRISIAVSEDARSGALVEVNCETDFVARTDDFLKLGNELAMQVAAMSPEYVSDEDVPADRIEREKEILAELTRNEGKPEQAIPKIVEGRLRKLLSELCLMDQIYVRSEKKQTVRAMVDETSANIGERIVVRRFVRLNIDEGGDGDAGSDE